MHREAVISASGSCAVEICKPVKIMCVTPEQEAKIDFEAIFCGLAFIRFFLVHSGRVKSDVRILKKIEDFDLDATSRAPSLFRRIFGPSRQAKKENLRSIYDQRKEGYYQHFERCVSAEQTGNSLLFRTEWHVSGLALFQLILRNSFEHDDDLRRPSDQEAIKASHEIYDMVIFSYNFLWENWEALVVNGKP